MEFSVVVCADAWIEVNGKVLLVKRAFSPMQGMWALPGGRVDAGESLRETCKREVLEELGLEVEVGEFSGAYLIPKIDADGKQLRRTAITIVFKCHVKIGELSVSNEVAACKWFSITNLPVDTIVDYSKPLGEVTHIDRGNYGQSGVREVIA